MTKCVEVEAPTGAIAQENGPLKELDVATAAPSPRRGSELAEESAAAPDEDGEVGLRDDWHTGLLQCTLTSPQENQDSDDPPEANAAPKGRNSASAQDEHLEIKAPLLVEAAGPEDATGMEAAAAAAEEEQRASATHSVDQDVGFRVDPADAGASRNCCEGRAAAAAAQRQLPVASLLSEEEASPSW